MLEKLKRKKVDRQQDTLPTNIEQLIEKYDLNSLWNYIDKIVDYSNTNNDLINQLPTIIDNAILENDIRKNPIGKIIFNTSGTNPANYLGFGTWILWGSGRVPVGVDTSDTDFNTVEKTGGDKSTNLEYVPQPGYGYQIGGTAYSDRYVVGKSNLSQATFDKGNLQPYITCYMWKRTN